MVVGTSRPKRSKRWVFRLVLIGVIAAAGYWFFSKPKADASAKRPQAPVLLATATRKDIPIYLSGLGTAQAYNTVTVHAQVDGQLMAIKFREGQNVKAGDVLAQIDPRTFKAALDQAVATKAKDEANLANAQVDVKRYQKLGDSIPRQTLDTQVATVRQLTAQVAADQAAIDSANTQLSYTTIVAPISGRTGLRQLDVGNIIHSGDANGLVVITQLQPIAVLFSLPQQELPSINQQISSGKTLAVDALASDNATVVDHGRLLLVDNQIDQTTGTIKLKAAFPNAQGQLWPGGFTNARLLLTTQSNRLTIPSVAVQQGPKGAYVFLFQPADSTVTMKPVTIGAAYGTHSVVTDGLADNDQVVVDGTAKLQDKSKVQVGGDDKKEVALPVTGEAKPADATEKPAGEDAAKPAEGPAKKHHKYAS